MKGRFMLFLGATFAIVALTVSFASHLDLRRSEALVAVAKGPPLPQDLSGVSSATLARTLQSTENLSSTIQELAISTFERTQFLLALQAILWVASLGCFFVVWRLKREPL